MTMPQTGLVSSGVLTRGLWAASLLVVTLLLPAQAQAPDVKPAPTVAAREIGAQPARSNVYREGGNITLIGIPLGIVLMMLFPLMLMLLLGTGACAIELYRQVRPGPSPPASGASVSGSLPHTTVVGN